MRKKRYSCLCIRIVVSIILGYSWTLLSLFVLPPLFGDVSYLPNSAPNPVGEFLMGQAVYGGCFVAFLSVAYSIKQWRRLPD